MKQLLFAVHTQQPSGTTYAAIMGGLVLWAAEATVRSPWPAPGVLRNLVVNLEVAPGAGTARTFRVRVNGAGTALVVTISDTATSAQLSGVDVPVAAGDLVALEHTATGAPAAATVRWALEFEGTTAKESGYTQTVGNANGGTSPRYTGVFAWAGLLTTATEVRNVVAAAGTLTRTTACVAAAPGAGNGFTFYVNRNGVRQDGAGGTVNTACALIGAGTTATASYSLPLLPGDVVYMEAVVSGSFTTRAWGLGTAFVATTDGQSQVCGAVTTLATAISEFFPACVQNPSRQSTETAFQARAVGGVTAIRLSGLRVVLGAAPGAGTSRTVGLRVNGASPGPMVTINGTETIGSDLTRTGAVASGDLWNLRAVPTGSPASQTVAWGFIQDRGGAPVASAEPFIWIPV